MLNAYFINQSKTFEYEKIEEVKLQSLESIGEYHHTALRRGYCPSSKMYRVPYSGIYGTGYVLITPSRKPNGKLNTNYLNVSYYIY